jgi:hypothetical protein
MPDLTDRIIEVASGPKSVTSDGTTVTQHSIPELIAAQETADTQAGVDNKKTRGLRFNRLVPPGSVG